MLKSIIHVGIYVQIILLTVINAGPVSTEMTPVWQSLTEIKLALISRKEVQVEDLCLSKPSMKRGGEN